MTDSSEKVSSQLEFWWEQVQVKGQGEMESAFFSVCSFWWSEVENQMDCETVCDMKGFSAA